MNNELIFRITDSKEILNISFEEKKRKNPQFSIRAWSKKLHFKNPSYLSEVLRGKRKMKPDFALRISSSLDLSEDGRRYFEALVFLENSTSQTEKEFYTSMLEKIRPQKQAERLDESVSSFKTWVYFFMDDITLLKDFRDDPVYLAKRLGPDVSPHIVELALKDALRIGLIKKNNRGKYERTKIAFIATNSPEERERAYEQYKKASWKRAEEAYLTQPIEKTRFAHFYLPIRKESFETIRQYLDEVRADIRKRFEATPGTAEEIYALELNLYKITLGDPSP